MAQELSEEQIKALQEKIKQMSPEELKEFQKKQCIFCQIVESKVQSRKIYEDEHVLAVLDINPANPGHILVMPRDHYSIMPQIPQEEVEHIFLAAKMLSNACLRALEVQGSNIIAANGVAAGQRAQHFMVHLIPRKENDNLDFEVPQKNIPEKELERIQGMLSESLGKKIMEKEKPMQIPLIPKRKEIVEAEFEEKLERETKPLKEKPAKKEAEPTKKTANEAKHPMEAKENKKTEADLDDIARILGAK